MTASAFESALYRVRESGDEHALGAAFADTEFFVSMLQEAPEQTDAPVSFAVYTGQRGEHVVMVSEDISRLAGGGSRLAAKMTGRELVPMLNPQLGVVAALESGEGFCIPAALLAQWRRAWQQA